MPAKNFLRHNWPAVTIVLTAAAIFLLALLMLSNMPPYRIVMATGPEGDAHHEIGERYRAALASALQRSPAASRCAILSLGAPAAPPAPKRDG
jgi:hypothetical protein